MSARGKQGEKRPKPTRDPAERQPRRTALVTGVTGQDGSYLAELLLEKGYDVVGVVRRTSHDSYERIGHLLDKIQVVPADLLDQHSLTTVIRDARPHEVYNLAAQSFVPTSWTQPVSTRGAIGATPGTTSRPCGSCCSSRSPKTTSWGRGGSTRCASCARWRSATRISTGAST